MAVAPTIRVHHVIDSLTWGGAEMLLGDLAAGAPSAGLEMSVAHLLDIDGSPAAERLRQSGIEPVHVPFGRIADPVSLPRLRRHLARVRPDVVHTHLTMADAVVPAVARSVGIPSVSTVHLIAPTRSGSSNGNRRELWRNRLAAASRRHLTGRVIAVSDAAREAYLATGWDAPPHVVTIRNGIARQSAADPERTRAELGLAPGALVLTTVSVLRDGKGHDIAIEAVRRLRPRFPALALVILGDGPARERIARQAQVLGDAVVMPGHRNDVLSVLAASDIVVHATRVDAFPTALLEAAAAGVPVVATRVGGVPEIVEHGRTGLLIEPPPTADALVSALAELLDDPARRRHLGAHARRVYEERFSAESWALRLRAVYEQVRAGRRA